MNHELALKIVDNIKEFEWESSIDEFCQKIIYIYKECQADYLIDFLLCLCINENFFKADSERYALVLLFRIMDDSELFKSSDKFHFRKMIYNIFLMTSFENQNNMKEVNYLKFNYNRLKLLEHILIGNLKEQTLSSIDQENLEDSYDAKSILFSKKIYNGIFPIISNPISNSNFNHYSNSQNLVLSNEIIAKTVCELASLIKTNKYQFLKPKFFTPIPEKFENGVPELFNDFILEFRLSESSNTPIIESFRHSLNQALKITLPMVDQQQIKEQIIEHPELVTFINLDKNDISTFIEYNPLIALEVLNEMINRCNIKDHLNILVNMEVSLASIEVMNKLAMNPSFPSDFLNIFVLNCIKKCHTINDKVCKSRLIRLVCVFIQSLIRNKVFLTQEVNIEISSFCLEFNKVKEAVTLYKLLKINEE